MSKALSILLGAFCGLAAAQAGDKPNVLWIYLEDQSPLFSCYGVDSNPTPTIDKLAESGVLFEQAMQVTPVCSTTRSSLITGMRPTTIGVHHHQSYWPAKSPLAIHLPKDVKTLPEMFKAQGYYTFNYGKEHYNFAYKRSDLYDGKYPDKIKALKPNFNAPWRDRAEGQPFFGQIQLLGGKHTVMGRGAGNPTDPDSVELPPYYPEHPLLKKYWAQHYDAARISDQETKQILDQLKEDGLLENTIVFFFSDHGYNLGVRDKQFCYNGGLHVPLIISWQGNSAVPAGQRRSDLVNGLDISATTLALAGLPIPGNMESQNLFASDYGRDHIISSRDRCDWTIDRIRTVRTENFRYVRNFMTDRPYMQPQYRDSKDYTKVLKQLYKDGKMNEQQAWFFAPERPAEEFYDQRKDPYETINLIDDPRYAAEIARHRKLLEDWIVATDDQGQYPESKGRLKAVKKKFKKKAVNPEYQGL